MGGGGGGGLQYNVGVHTIGDLFHLRYRRSISTNLLAVFMGGKTETSLPLCIRP